MSIAVIQTKNAKHNAAWHGQDMLLALASMDLNPQLILTGGGIELWLNNHDETRNNRSLQKRYTMLELFDCPAPWVNQRELDTTGYAANDFIAEVKILDDEEWQQRLAELTKVLTY